jgi:hypothetical protein
MVVRDVQIFVMEAKAMELEVGAKVSVTLFMATSRLHAYI